MKSSGEAEHLHATLLHFWSSHCKYFPPVIIRAHNSFLCTKTRHHRHIHQQEGKTVFVLTWAFGICKKDFCANAGKLFIQRHFAQIAETPPPQRCLTKNEEFIENSSHICVPLWFWCVCTVSLCASTLTNLYFLCFPRARRPCRKTTWIVWGLLSHFLK